MSKSLALGLMMLASLLLGTPCTTRAQTHAPEHAAVPAQAEVSAHGQTAAAGEHGRTHQVIEFDPATALWVLIIFFVLLVVLYPTAWKGVLASLKAREERIRKDIADAEASRQKAEATLRDYNQQLATAEGKVRDMLARATADGQKLADGIRQQAQAEAEQIKQRTARDLDAAKQQAVQEIHAYTVDLATSIAAKILQKNINPDDQKELVRSSLEQLQKVNKN